MLIPCSICLSFMSVMIDSLVRRRPVPSGAARVVVNIISSAKRIDPPLPSGRERTELILISIEVVLCRIVRRHCLNRCDNARCRKSGRVLRDSGRRSASAAGANRASYIVGLRWLLFKLLNSGDDGRGHSHDRRGGLRGGVRTWGTR